MSLSCSAIWLCFPIASMVLTFSICFSPFIFLFDKSCLEQRSATAENECATEGKNPIIHCLPNQMSSLHIPISKETCITFHNLIISRLTQNVQPRKSCFFFFGDMRCLFHSCRRGKTLMIWQLNVDINVILSTGLTWRGSCNCQFCSWLQSLMDSIG